MYDPHHPNHQPENQPPNQPRWPSAQTLGPPAGPPAEPFPRLRPGPPPPQDPERGARPWILATIGLVLAAAITWGSIALWGGDETGAIKPGAAEANQGDELYGDDPTDAGPSDDGAGVYSLPAQPCDLVDIDRLERQYGPVTEEPMEVVEGDPARFELAVCQATFGPGGETRVTVAMGVVSDSTADDIAGNYAEQFADGCETVEGFGGNWEFGRLSSGEGCVLGGGAGYVSTNIVITDNDAMWATQVVTGDPTRSQGEVDAVAKTLAQEAVIQARRQATGS